MPKMVKIAQVGDLSPGEGKVIEVESQSIALFNVDGTFHAMQNTCTHAGGPLGEGELEGHDVTCPWHGAQFNVTTGKVLGPPAGSDVKSFVVTVEGDEVLVDLE
ncbi:MAG: non-heme iron oxygenase ferredoxin subunit [Myxococcota bacterium]